jgi:hypothetical protein
MFVSFEVGVRLPRVGDLAKDIRVLGLEPLPPSWVRRVSDKLRQGARPAE